MRLRLPTLLLAAMSVAGCSADAASDDPPPPSTPDPEEPTTPSAPVATPTVGRVHDRPPPSRPLETVGHDREIRGAWISSVYNGTWPSRTGLTPAAAQAELVAMLDAMASARMNAVFLQVRPESDALYPSTLEPWSRFLTGKQGVDPGWDPLAFAIGAAHARGLELHAWINPYRGLVNGSIETAPTHVAKTLSDRAYAYGTQVWMDPGAPEVRAHILDVLRDILARYDVDGLHFDDYFYPYPVAGTTFPDDGTYALYTQGGGALAKADWRRSNVDALVREAGDLVAKVRPDVRFGISPFGIYRPGTPAGVTGLDAYDTLYCDPPKWIAQGWVDYLAPQLYWPTTKAGQPYGALATWWAGLATSGRTVIVGHDLGKLGAADWPVSEVELQVSLARAERPKGMRGDVFFTAKQLTNDVLGVRTALAANAWAAPALSPPLASASKAPPIAPPLVAIAKRVVTLSPPPGGPALRAYVVHREAAGGGWTIARVVPASATTATTELEPGRWAVSAVDRRGVESGGVPFAIE